MLHKIFNENTVKVSCSYLSNMSSIIPSRSKRLLRPITTKHCCNCGTRENCSLQNQCLNRTQYTKLMLISNANKGPKVYFGLAETSFKTWFANQNKDFNHEQYKKSTKFSKYIWSLKIMSRIIWLIVEKVYGRTKIFVHYA